jgi:hypothetical protein
LQVFKTVFSKPSYVILAIAIFCALFIGLSIISEYLFLSPYLTLNVSFSELSGFLLIIAVSAMSGIVIVMNVYRIKALRKSMKSMGGGFLGSIIGASAGACSCGSIGFAVISVFGTAGGIATSFLTNYEIPLRLVSLAILGYTYYATTKALSFECKIKN